MDGSQQGEDPESIWKAMCITLLSIKDWGHFFSTDIMQGISISVG